MIAGLAATAGSDLNMVAASGVGTMARRGRRLLRTCQVLRPGRAKLIDGPERCGPACAGRASQGRARR